MKRLIPIAIALISTGCASIFSGSTQDITIRTTPGAKYAISDSYGRTVASGDTQGTATIERGVGYFSPHAYKAKITKPGHRPKIIDIEPGMNPWYFGNILLGGVVGMLIVDPITGAMYKFYPDNIDAQLEPLENSGAAINEQAPSQLQPVAKTKPVQLTSRFEYAAYQRAKDRGCKAITAPAFDGVLVPHETLVFQCTDGRSLTVTCDSQNGCS